MAKQCQLCKQTPLRFSEAKKLNKDTLCWLEAVSEEKISPQSLICCGCEMYIHRHKGDYTTTRWNSVDRVDKQFALDDCMNEASRMISTESVVMVLGNVSKPTDV